MCVPVRLFVVRYSVVSLYKIIYVSTISHQHSFGTQIFLVIRTLFWINKNKKRTEKLQKAITQFVISRIARKKKKEEENIGSALFGVQHSVRPDNKQTRRRKERVIFAISHRITFKIKFVSLAILCEIVEQIQIPSGQFQTESTVKSKRKAYKTNQNKQQPWDKRCLNRSLRKKRLIATMTNIR